jgi:hypothetical protein
MSNKQIEPTYVPTIRIASSAGVHIEVTSLSAERILSTWLAVTEYTTTRCMKSFYTRGDMIS